jgi:hypothetical protein
LILRENVRSVSQSNLCGRETGYVAVTNLDGFDLEIRSGEHAKEQNCKDGNVPMLEQILVSRDH